MFKFTNSMQFSGKTMMKFSVNSHKMDVTRKKTHELISRFNRNVSREIKITIEILFKLQFSRKNPSQQNSNTQNLSFFAENVTNSTKAIA